MAVLEEKVWQSLWNALRQRAVVELAEDGYRLRMNYNGVEYVTATIPNGSDIPAVNKAIQEAVLPTLSGDSEEEDNGILVRQSA